MGGADGMVRSVKKERFTMKAAILWSTVPKEAKERVLKNCFCPQCEGAAGFEPELAPAGGRLG